ncbi:helix-turn-helix domain-containing protein [Nocardia huaxiensis]|uniref:Helix-turn-helix transcriptional regulator n=1 Tax=Nocardia huaxiensis TaxID=2755382 RepID=A0A7D6Z2L8_9NOCA|nr:helix-turn-helix transcriptional regulator [Nocardia huaxiensis]QLY31306.1 helix-turn-helix transcriptional regulator [Nocardia huaxiensis]UFS94848.1 helix-turn-helix transcriptional regulator [Nocardia huaxiensis]
MAESTLGARVAELRRRRGLSQKELGAAIRRSESWVSQVERDVLPVERLSVLQRLADVLGVAVRDLRPEAAEPMAAHRGEGPRGGSVVFEQLRLLLTGHPALDQLFGDAADRESADALPELRQRVDLVWQLANESRLIEVGSSLLGLIPELEQAARTTSGKRPEALTLLSRAYQVAATAFTRQEEVDAAWVAADRALSAAEESGDPLSVVAGTYRMAQAFLRLQRLEQAEQAARVSVAALTPQVEDKEGECRPEVLSLYGSLQLMLAVIAATDGNRAAARAGLSAAREAAERLGEGRNDFDTEFGPTGVAVHAVAVAVELGDAGEALDTARTVQASVLSPERQARFLVDVARAHAQRRQAQEALEALLNAERLTPELVHTDHRAREVVRDLLQFAGRRPADELRELAGRAAVTP